MTEGLWPALIFPHTHTHTHKHTEFTSDLQSKYHQNLLKSKHFKIIIIKSIHVIQNVKG